MDLTHYSGFALFPGAQIAVIRYPEGTFAWLLPTNSNSVTDAVLDNPYTTDLFTGFYDFWTVGIVRIVELK